jgi:sugar/nucleoside kinase (ribokinase family)
VASFAKSVGGCPANIAIGTARLGLRSALLTRVGDEQMGRFIREQMLREGVSDGGIVTDKERLTALVLLAVENEGVSADLLSRKLRRHGAVEADIDEATSSPRPARSSSRARISRGRAPMRRSARRSADEAKARRQGGVRHRLPPEPVGARRPRRRLRKPLQEIRPGVEHIKRVLADCDLIVGTEEEVMIASGRDDPCSPHCAIRAVSATIVLKRGPMGCIVYDGAIRTISRTASSARASRSRSTTCWAPAMPSCPASCAAGWAARAWRDLGDLGQCLRRLRRVAAALLAGEPDLDRAAAFPGAMAARTGRCARTRRSTTSIGRPRGGMRYHQPDGARRSTIAASWKHGAGRVRRSSVSASRCWL